MILKILIKWILTPLFKIKLISELIVTLIRKMGRHIGSEQLLERTLFDSQNMTVNIFHTGNISYDIGNGYAFYTYTEQATGTSSTGSLSINVNEGYWRFIGNNSNLSTFVMNTEITNNSSGNFSGTTYQYQNAMVFWAAASVIYGGYYNKVVDANLGLRKVYCKKMDKLMGPSVQWPCYKWHLRARSGFTFK